METATPGVQIGLGLNTIQAVEGAGNSWNRRRISEWVQTCRKAGLSKGQSFNAREIWIGWKGGARAVGRASTSDLARTYLTRLEVATKVLDPTVSRQPSDRRSPATPPAHVIC